MPRKEQQTAKRGSQKWLQVLVNDKPEILDREIAQLLQLESDNQIEWLSPMKDDAYAEYSDDEFLERLKVNLNQVTLGNFWPRRGPVWDGLGRTNRGDVILLEAKAHIAEMVSL